MPARVGNTDSIRKCEKCKESKSLSRENFHNDKSRYLGFSYVCISCEKHRARLKYIKNPRTGRYNSFTKEQKEAKLLTAKKYGRTDKGRAIYMSQAYKRIDLKKGTKSTITAEFLMKNIFHKPCVYCGDTKRIGCDRINNSIGHTVENVVPCCFECNLARMHNFTHEEMFIIGKAIKEIKSNRLFLDLPHYEI